VRGARVVTCPENKAPAGVTLDVLSAVKSAFGTPDLRLSECSRWPERQGCGQECLAQIEAAPEDCLVRNMLTKWYNGKACAICDKQVGHIDWLEHKPAFLGPDQKTRGWGDIPSETVPEVLATHRPVCWDCHVALTFRREFPDLVTERPASKNRITGIH
jgi:hypothetical protein